MRKELYKQRIDFICDHGHHGGKLPYSGRAKIEGFAGICFSHLAQLVECDAADGNLLYQGQLRFVAGPDLVFWIDGLKVKGGAIEQKSKRENRQDAPESEL